MRIRPSDFATSFPEGTLTPRVAAAADARARPRTTSTTTSARTLNVDLNDLSRERWSLLPQQGDLIAEVRTKRFGNLTYARIQSDAEDVSFFDRRRKKNIADLRVAREARDARPLLQRGRLRRLRRHDRTTSRPTSAPSGCGSTAGPRCR